MRTVVCWPLFVLVLFPLASSAVPLASPEEDRRAKQAVPPQGQALVYVYRADGGAQVSPTVSLNNRTLGVLDTRTYYMVPVTPGRVDLRAGDGAALSIRAQDGRIYFVQLTVTSAGDGSLAQVSYGRGRQDVHAARLAREGQTAVARRDKPRAAARAEASDAPEAPHAGRAGFNLIVKGGSFSLASGSQSILTVPLTISTGSTGFGLEGEWIIASGWAFGAEYLSHSHFFTTSSGSGDMAVTVVMLNAKKYFRYGATVQPYVGVGLGSTVADLSSTGAVTVNGTAGGFAVQAMGGVAFRWEHVGLYTELKYQSARAEDANGEGVDVGGMGVFAGVSVLF